MHILILDQGFGGAVNKPVTYSNFLSSDDNVKLLIITSKGLLSQKDKESCLAYAEIDTPTKNGSMEVWAVKFHKQYGIDLIYTKQEDLILRASYLRRLLGLSIGLSPHAALVYRDKEVMKRVALNHGINVPAFQRVFSPVDILDFATKEGFPIVVKPTLGCASSGVKVLHSETEMNNYLEFEFYERIDEQGKLMDYSGDILVEKFIEGKMYHVNGYAQNGELVYVWPFEYISTNLDFTKGKAYGNVSIPISDSRYERLFGFTQTLLKALPTPRDLMFHLEVFEVQNPSHPNTPDYYLCEIAARRPGGSIALLIDALEGGKELFPEIEFRCNNGLPLRHDRKPDPNLVVADLMIPRKIGRLVSMPGPETPCPVPDVKVIPIVKAGTEYHGFDINVFNTAVRVVASSNAGGVPQVKNTIQGAHQWVDQSWIYESLSSTPAESK